MHNFGNRRKKYGKVHQSFYTPMNPHKWNTTPVLFLSEWERKAYIKLDTNPKVIQVTANAYVIPYICGTDHRQHKYYMDVVFQCVNGDRVDTIMIEIKPDKSLRPPRPPKRKTQKSFKTFQSETLAYTKNMSKWKAAQEIALRNGWVFLIMTEKGIYTFINNVPNQMSNISIF